MATQNKRVANALKKSDLFFGKGPRPWRWKKGHSGNPGGRRPLPEEIRKMKEESVEKAIQIFHSLISDPKYTARLATNSSDLSRFAEVIFDRFGLPKVTRQEMSGPDGKPMKLEQQQRSDLVKILGPEKVKKLAEMSLEDLTKKLGLE